MSLNFAGTFWILLTYLLYLSWSADGLEGGVTGFSLQTFCGVHSLQIQI